MCESHHTRRAALAGAVAVDETAHDGWHGARDAKFGDERWTEARHEGRPRTTKAMARRPCSLGRP